MAKGSSHFGGRNEAPEGEMSTVVKHLQKLETENAELRKQLEDVIAFIGKPNVRQAKKKRRLRQLSPTSRVQNHNLEQPASRTPMRETSFQPSRPTTSAGMREDAGPVTIHDLDHDPSHSHMQPVVVRKIRPSTSSGTRSQHDNLRPIQSSSAHTPHSRRATVQQRSLSRSAPIVVPNREQAPAVAWQQQQQSPVQSRLKPRQAVKAPIRPSTTIGTREDKEEPLSSPSNSQAWQAYRRARRRPNTSLGTRIRASSPEHVEGQQSESGKQRFEQQRRSPSPQRQQRPVTATTERCKSQKSDPIASPSRWKSKTFNQEDFESFLARQSQHANSVNRRSLDMEQLTGLSRMQAAPLLPISSFLFRIDGGTYVENDGKVKAKKMQQLSASASSDLSLFKSESSRPSSPAKERPRNTEVLDTAPWRAFLSRQAELLRRREDLSKSPDPLASRSGSKAKAGAPPEEGAEVFERFLKRNLDYRQAKEQYLSGLHKFYCPAPLSPRVQDPHFMVRHDPKNVHAVFEEAVEEAKAKWRVDQPLEPGQSPLFKKKAVRPDEVEQFWEKNKDFPHVSNRERPTSTEPPEPGFNFTGNPYEGGKAEKLLEKLGPKSGITLPP